MMNTDAPLMADAIQETHTIPETEGSPKRRTPPVFFNPFTPGFEESPYEHYRMLRDTDPVQEHPMGFWFVSRHAEVSKVVRDARMSVKSHNLTPGPIRDQINELIADTPLKRVSMVVTDPPDHTRLRSLVGRVFTPRAIAAMEPMITGLVDASLDRIADAGSVDLAEAFAYPLPFTVITTMLGMPDADPKRLLELTEALVIALEPPGIDAAFDIKTKIAVEEAEAELSGMMQEIIAWKRKHPADDLLTALTQAEQHGDLLTDEELVAQVMLLYLAGHHTTVNLIGNGVIALLRNPDQLALLRSNPDLIGNAVEEFLRYESPLQETSRITLAPYPLGDREIPPGALVVTCIGSANRDERVFGPDADKLRIDREQARQHVSFSLGAHHCLGSALGRLEARVAIGRLVARFPRLALAGPVRWNGRINVRGAKEIPVSV
ncbi:cytochrome P450 [Lysobacter hankyongensis]|uniref:Cytochrome P450 n=1 Tax=Lysobacter hankyongensis TaxID=1176535 RepID=A0ABP9C861_9GAMM